MGLPLPALVFQVRKCWLVHQLQALHRHQVLQALICNINTDLFRVSLALGQPQGHAIYGSPPCHGRGAVLSMHRWHWPVPCGLM